jgi:3-oxoacyl-[acyl-carrier protein] reductase
MDLAKANALVTGGSGAIGHAIATELAAAGADITIGYQTDEAGAKKAVEAARTHNVDAEAVAADITDNEAVETLVERATDPEPVTVLVNCAGVTNPHAIENLDRESFHRSLVVNVESATAVTQAVVARLCEATDTESAAVVNVSSVAAELGTVDTSYAASKAGLLGVTRALARELGSENIRVNAVAPGPVDTPMNDRILEFLEEQRFRGHETVDTLLDRYEAQPEEVASAVRFLTAHDFVTGEVLHVDGGMSL